MKTGHIRWVLWAACVILLGATAAVGYFGSKGPAPVRQPDSSDEQALLRQLSAAGGDVVLPELDWAFMREKVEAPPVRPAPETPDVNPAIQKELERYITVVGTAVAADYACALLQEGDPANRRQPQKSQVRRVGSRTKPGAVITAIEGNSVTFEYKGAKVTLAAKPGRIPVIVKAKTREPPMRRPPNVPRLEDLPPFEEGEFYDRVRRLRRLRELRRRRAGNADERDNEDIIGGLHVFDEVGLELPGE